MSRAVRQVGGGLSWCSVQQGAVAHVVIFWLLLGGQNSTLAAQLMPAAPALACHDLCLAAPATFFCGFLCPVAC
jgi:hypothetical protein